MSRQVAIGVALLVAVGALVAAMAWSTAARGQVPGEAGYATFEFGHSLRG